MVALQTIPDCKRGQRMSIRPNRAEVIALAALVVAMGGSGYAAVSQLADGSVTAATLRNGAVTEGKLGTGAVTARSIRDGAVGFREIGPDAVQLEDISAGAVVWGHLSPKLQTYVTERGQFSVERRTTSGTADANQPWRLALGCRSGQLLIGGGFDVPAGVAVRTSTIDDDSREWVVRGTAGTTRVSVTAYSLCLLH